MHYMTEDLWLKCLMKCYYVTCYWIRSVKYKVYTGCIQDVATHNVAVHNVAGNIFNFFLLIQNLPGHSLDHLKVLILEQVKFKDEEYRLEMEKKFIRKFDTFNEGINNEL